MSNIAQNIRLNVGAPFPANVRGSNFVTVSKKNGLWTVGADYTVLQVGSIPDSTVKQLAAYDTQLKTYTVVTLQQIAVVVASLVSTSGIAGAILNTARIVTAAGAVTVDPVTDQIIMMSKSIGAPTSILLPTAASRTGVPVTVKDLKGDAATNNITFVPNGTETIDGFSPAAAIANGVAVIDTNYGKRTLSPLPGGGGWYWGPP